MEPKKPEQLRDELSLQFPTAGQGADGLIILLDKILKYSVNTWHQGFLDKLYASTNAPGLAAELILAALNTNVHVYQVSPVLTLIEKYTAKQLALLFGLSGPNSGGISVQGGSASNTTSIVIARNTLFPDTKTNGYSSGRKFVLFTSAHGHYSIEKAAQMLGFGSKAVWQVPVDGEGRMIPAALGELVEKAKAEGRTPFYVNATAGSTVLGSFDPFIEIASICQKHGLWFHIDGSWGGSFVFSSTQKFKLAGSEHANSIAINPHKMLGAPLTCSFLLGSDLRQFHRANTLPAGYLFHNNDDENDSDNKDITVKPDPEVWDLADLTLQCGRRGDSLKLFLSWTYYGSIGYAKQIDSACSVAAYLANRIRQSTSLLLVSTNPPPCLQVCFYYAPLGKLPFRHSPSSGELSTEERAKRNSRITEKITKRIVKLGFMIDYAPPAAGADEESIGNGKFFRCVVNVRTEKKTVDALVDAIIDVGSQVLKEEKGTPQLIETLNLPESTVPPHAPPFIKNPFNKGHGPAVHQ